MIKKLQKKFIFTTMVILFIVLFVIISGINVFGYIRLVSDADEILMLLSENKGNFPHALDKKDFIHQMSPELPYESRYFFITFDNKNQSIIETETTKIVTVDIFEAIKFARNVAGDENAKGFVEHFRYIVNKNETVTRVIFLDCGRKLDDFYHFLIISVIVALVGFALVSSIIAISSNKIIRPILESYEKQKRFITDAGHELKTPLTIINADADVLEMEYGKNEWIEDIQKQIENLTELTNDLIYLARMEEADGNVPMIDFLISDSVNDIAASFKVLAQAKGESLVTDIEPMLSLKGNESLINRLVSVLLDNAVKYSKKDSEIIVSLKKQSSFIKLTVKNVSETEITGETLPLLFERFYRTDPSRNSQKGGNGIGLSMAKAITELHMGKINAVVEDKYNLEISVYFPN